MTVRHRVVVLRRPYIYPPALIAEHLNAQTGPPLFVLLGFEQTVYGHSLLFIVCGCVLIVLVESNIQKEQESLEERCVKGMLSMIHPFVSICTASAGGDEKHHIEFEYRV